MRRGALLGALLALTGCADLSLGVSGCSGLPGRPFVVTPENTVEGGLRTTVTAAGTRFLIANRELLARLLLDVDASGRVRLPLPQVDFGANGRGLGVGVRDLVVGFDLRAVDLDLAFLDAPARMRFTVRGARLSLQDGIVWISVGGNAACRLGNGLDRGTPDEAILLADFAVDVTLEVDPAGNFLSRVDVLPFTVHGLDVRLQRDDALPECNDGITDAECRLACGLGDLGLEIVEALYDAFRQTMDELVQPVVQAAVDLVLERFNGQPLFVEGEVHPRALVGLLPTAGDAHPLGFRAGPSAEGFRVRSLGNDGDGIDLTVDVGLDTPDHPCVPAAGPPPGFEAGAPPALTGFDFRGEPYHLGLSLSDAVLNRALWVAYRAGVLCVALDSDRIEALLGQRVTTDTLALVMPGLKELSGGPRPILIALDPRFRAADFPLVSLREVADRGGLPQAGIRADLPDLGLSFYAFLEERWTRLFSVRVDVSAELTVSATPDDALAISMAPPSITGLAQTYNELLDSTNLPDLLDLVVNLLTAALLRDGITLDVGIGGLVSQVTGLPLDAHIAALRTEGGAGDYLSVLISLRPVGAGAGARAVVDTEAALLESDPASGRVRLAVSAPGAGDARYQWRVDNGPWRPFAAAADGVLQVDEPLLRVRGPHALAVRAVDVAEYRSLDPTPAQVDVRTEPREARPTAAGTPANAAGCRAADGAAMAPLLGMLLLLLPLRRRRR